MTHNCPTLKQQLNLGDKTIKIIFTFANNVNICCCRHGWVAGLDHGSEKATQAERETSTNFARRITHGIIRSLDSPQTSNILIVVAHLVIENTL